MTLLSQRLLETFQADIPSPVRPADVRSALITSRRPMISVNGEVICDLVVPGTTVTLNDGTAGRVQNVSPSSLPVSYRTKKDRLLNNCPITYSVTTSTGALVDTTEDQLITP